MKKMKMVVAKMIKPLLITIGIIIVLAYALPLAAGILNAGNIFGLGAGSMIILLGVFIKPFSEFIKAFCENKIGKGIFVALLFAAIVFILMFISTLACVYHAGEYSAEHEKTVIVLGCKVRGTVPSIALEGRTRQAIKHLEQNSDAVVILSGGQGPDEKISEAECMKNIMVKSGIDESRIYLEDKSTNTDENIAFSKRIIDENKLSSNVAIATSNYHQKRAIMIAEKNGLTAASLPSDTDRFSRLTFYTREVFGVWVQWIKSAKN